jgi:phosphomannomutase
VSLAGDLRPSTTRLVAEADGRGEILQAVARAVVDSGLALDYLGHVPSPALMLHAVRRGQPSVMVTGSHIPFDRNGIKFNGSRGEVLKSDEPEILDRIRRVRAEVYATAFETSSFDARGMLRPE